MWETFSFIIATKTFFKYLGVTIIRRTLLIYLFNFNRDRGVARETGFGEFCFRDFFSFKLEES